MPLSHPTRRERKRQQLCDHVAATAFGLFEAQGFEAVTMEQVAAAADVAKGTLYKYFPVKEALLAHQFQRDIASGMRALWQILEQQNSFVAQMRRFLHASVKWNEARRPYLPYYVRFQFGTPGVGGARQIFEQLCAAGQRRGDVRSDLSAVQLAMVLECMWLGAVMNWLGTPNGNLKTQFDALLLLALNGVGP